MQEARCVAESPVPSDCEGARHLLGDKRLCGDETGVTWFLTGELLPAAETRNPGVNLFQVLISTVLVDGVPRRRSPPRPDRIDYVCGVGHLSRQPDELAAIH